MLESRLHVDKSQTQSVTSLVLSVHAAVSMIAGPLIGYFADKFENRKYSLLMSLGAEMIGTVVIMIAPSGKKWTVRQCDKHSDRVSIVPIILVGRAIQAVGGSAAWIVGYATLADTVGRSHMGKVLGGIMSFFASGSLFGPMTSGLILPSFGYWATWMFAILVLVIDMIMRVVMIEHKPSQETHHATNDSINKLLPDIEATPANTAEVNERTALFHAPVSETEDQNCAKPQAGTGAAVCESNSVPQHTPSHENFYLFILTSSRALTALTCHCAMGVILLSLDTTLPLHAHRNFGWDTSQIGLMFLLLQLPSLLFGSLLGTCRDRFGTRFLACFGFLTAGVSIWFLGAASDIPVFAKHNSEAVSMASLVGIGVARSCISGTGVLEITSKCSSLLSLRIVP